MQGELNFYGDKWDAKEAAFHMRRDPVLVWDVENKLIVSTIWDVERALKSERYSIDSSCELLLSSTDGIDLRAQYIDNNQEIWSVKVFGVEDHGSYRVALIEIRHKYPWYEYDQPWNKYNPVSWKYDWEPTLKRMLSPWKYVPKNYRIQYDPDRLNPNEIFSFWGKVKDWKKHSLNNHQILLVLQEIESMV